eukprot:CAMPEP_0168187368 /NCGR_PEP_ID=MMETSP0139_2-20121125/14991_1 /TAXON_ID=44445 /ORGANISM="Pseudo-nitzschia australis, Strain 10249 10 AB" /LENGTH=219 /DNA_ID=CAMNT_0008109563 /DNA_START=106 /DNA_END=765 /DNA_ORIENTATION=+
MAGSAAAGETISFAPPIPFTQFDSSCEGDILYTGSVVSIKKITAGSFCVADNIVDEDGTSSVAYSKVDIIACETDAIYENWAKCGDADCGDCEAEYKAYTGWDSINPASGASHCYDYTFSMDPMEKTTRKVKTEFFNTMDIYYRFDDDANADDIKAYVGMMDTYSCIAEGKPVATAATAEDPTKSAAEADPAVEEIVSGSSALAATAAFAMASATAMLI